MQPQSEKAREKGKSEISIFSVFSSKFIIFLFLFYFFNFNYLSLDLNRVLLVPLVSVDAEGDSGVLLPLIDFFGWHDVA